MLSIGVFDFLNIGRFAKYALSVDDIRYLIKGKRVVFNGEQ